MKRSLILRRLSVNESPGFKRGLPKFDEFSPGVNIIHGPNGAGKSSTARAAMQLLWPDAPRPKRLTADAAVTYDESDWTIEAAGGRLDVRRDGARTVHPTVMQDQVRDRYYLGLDELVGSDDRDFAKAVQKESAGGYDPEAAAADLGFADRRPRRGEDQRRCDEAARVVREAEEEQRRLLDEEELLVGLEADEEDARESQRKADLLQKAIALVDAEEELRRAQAALAVFPAEMDKLTGTEERRLKELNASLADESARLHKARAEEASVREALEKLGPTAARIEKHSIGQTAALVDHLDQLAVGLENNRRELERARAVEAQEARRLGPDFVEQTVEDAVLADLADLAAFARQAEIVRAGLAARRELETWLGPDQAPPDTEKLHDGLNFLLRRLSDPETTPPGSLRLLLWALGGALVSAGGMAAWLVRWDWLGLAAAGCLCFLAALRPVRIPPILEQRQEDFLRLGLEPPVSWSRDDIEERAESLRRELAAAELAVERRQRWAGLADRRAELEADAEELEAWRSGLVARLGAAPDADEASLLALVEGLRRWQDARNLAAEIAAVIEALEAEWSQDLALLNGTLGEYDIQVRDNREGRTAVRRLESLEADYQRESGRLQQIRRHLDELRLRLKALENDRAALPKGVGLEPDDEAGLLRFCEQRPEYLAARDTLRQAEAARNAAAAGAGSDAPIDRPREELVADLEEARRQADRLAEVSRQIGAITEAVASAKARHDLEAALARQDDALARLTEMRRADVESSIGWLLTQHVVGQSRDLSMPQVFKRASEVFASITDDRYELDFDLRVPAFQARDTVTGLVLELDELSSGTRVQLLLAVRVAFVEEQEQGPRLPIFLDETLANSDETRARAVMSAAVRLARGGRQVFYFTARNWEVARWREVLDQEREAEYRIIDLGLLLGLEQPELPETPEPLPEIPDPGDMDIEEYGRLIRAPGFDPTVEEIGATHIWHMADDPRLVRDLLRLRLDRWGQVQSLIRRGVPDALAMHRDALARAEAAARLLAEAARLRCIGLSRPVSRTDLDAGGVSGRFIDEVDLLADEVNRDPHRLVASLEEGRISGFRKRKIDQLREHLLDQDLLDERPPMTAEEIRLRVLEASDQDLAAGLLTPERIDRLLAKVVPPEPTRPDSGQDSLLKFL